MYSYKSVGAILLLTCVLLQQAIRCPHGRQVQQKTASLRLLPS